MYVSVCERFKKMEKWRRARRTRSNQQNAVDSVIIIIIIIIILILIILIIILIIIIIKITIITIKKKKKEKKEMKLIRECLEYSNLHRYNKCTIRLRDLCVRYLSWENCHFYQDQIAMTILFHALLCQSPDKHEYHAVPHTHTYTH